MSSTSRRRIGVAAVALLLGMLVAVAATTSAGAGRPAPAQLAFDVTTYGFGSVTVGDPPLPHTFTLSNTGGKGASSLSVGVTGAMTLVGNGCGKTLKPGASCNVTVAFYPQSVGDATGTLTATARGISPATVALTGSGAAAAADRYLYWGDPDIGRSALDGTALMVDFVPLTEGFFTLDVGAGYLYWTDSGSVWRLPTDGTGDPLAVHETESGSGELLGVAVADPNLYWTNYSTKEIWRSGLDGAGAEAILTGLDNPTGVDVADGYVYWTEYSGASTSKVRRASLGDLSATPDVLYEYPDGSSRGPAGLEVGNGRVYWAESDWMDYTASILSAPITGGDARVEVALTSPSRIDDVALDIDGGWVYFTANEDDDDGDSYDSAIARHRLDGTGEVEQVVVELWLVTAVAIG